MKKILFLAAFLFSLILANAQPPNVPANSGAIFGEKITEENAITTGQLANMIKLNQRQNKATEVKVKGVVNSVCEEMGCWLTIKSADGNMMIKMKDHSFFVPLAITGKEVVVDGVAEEKITSVEQLKHYAKDAGKTEEEIAKITEPKKEIIIEAKGVLVL